MSCYPLSMTQTTAGRTPFPATPGTKFIIGGAIVLTALALAGLSTGFDSSGEIPPIMIMLTDLMTLGGSVVSLLAVGEYMNEMVKK